MILSIRNKHFFPLNKLMEGVGRAELSSPHGVDAKWGGGTLGEKVKTASKYKKVSIIGVLSIYNAFSQFASPKIVIFLKSLR